VLAFVQDLEMDRFHRFPSSGGWQAQNQRASSELFQDLKTGSQRIIELELLMPLHNRLDKLAGSCEVCNDIP